LPETINPTTTKENQERVNFNEEQPYTYRSPEYNDNYDASQIAGSSDEHNHRGFVRGSRTEARVQLIAKLKADAGPTGRKILAYYESATKPIEAITYVEIAKSYPGLSENAVRLAMNQILDAAGIDRTAKPASGGPKRKRGERGPDKATTVRTRARSAQQQAAIDLEYAELRQMSTDDLWEVFDSEKRMTSADQDGDIANEIPNERVETSRGLRALRVIQEREEASQPVRVPTEHKALRICHKSCVGGHQPGEPCRTQHCRTQHKVDRVTRIEPNALLAWLEAGGTGESWNAACAEWKRQNAVAESAYRLEQFLMPRPGRSVAPGEVGHTSDKRSSVGKRVKKGR
jgi:hypothetical protein